MTKLIEYKIQDIPVKNLSVVWVKSQRPFNKAHAENIANNFDPDKFEPIIVTMPNGEGVYHIVEGQHRRVGLEIFAGRLNRDGYGGNELAPCRVIDHANPAKAAEIWLGINGGRKAISSVTAFLVAVEAKREEETAINTVVRQTGYHVSANTRMENSIAAVSSLRKVYHMGTHSLKFTLNTCRLLWGADPAGTSSWLIQGTGRFVHEYHTRAEPVRLKHAILKKYKSPFKLLEAGRVFAEKMTDTLPISIAELMRRAYNDGLKEDKRLKRKE
jgi:hypothetical protein